MIILRKTDGSAEQVAADVKFVEMVNDADGTIMCVLVQVQPGQLLRINAGSADAVRYENLFKSRAIRFTPQLIERVSQ